MFPSASLNHFEQNHYRTKNFKFSENIHLNRITIKSKKLHGSGSEAMTANNYQKVI